MAFGSEVTGKLGIDTASVPQDLAAAKGAMQKFANDAEAVGGKAGAGAGDKLTNALEHRILGARHLSGALATALGLNIENLAEHVTAALVGGTKEAWKQMGEIAEENAKLIEKRMELAMTPKQIQEKIKKDVGRAVGDEDGTKAKLLGEQAMVTALGAQIPFFQQIAALTGVVSSEAERQVAIGKADLKINEAEVRLAEQKKAVVESNKKLEEYILADRMKHMTSSEKIVELEKQAEETGDLIFSGKLSELEVNEQIKHLIELQGALADENAARTQREIDQKKEILRLQQSYAEAARKLADDEEALANKRADRGKLTIDEIANLKPGQTAQHEETKHVDTFGLSAEAAAAKEQAVELQRQQREAERLRSTGDVAGANAMFDQIGAGKQKLVDSGFAKSTEGDDFKRMAEALHKDNMEISKILNEIKTVAAGKIKNQ